MKSRHIIYLILVLLSTATPIRLNAADHMVLYHKSGTLILLSLQEQPSIKFTDNGLSIGTSRYDIGELDKYTFVDPASLNSLDLSNGIVFGSDGILHLPSFGNVDIYDSKGVKVNCESSSDKNGISIDMNGLQAGTYIVSFGGKSVKIFIRRKDYSQLLRCYFAPQACGRMNKYLYSETMEA